MADPITVIGAMGAIANIIDVVAKSVKKLDEMRNRWANADLTALSMASQLTALRAALTKIQEWMTEDLEGAHHQLVMDLDVSLSCCKLLTAKIEQLLQGMELRVTLSNLTFAQRMRVLYTEGNVDDIEKMLGRQINALNLLLTACNCKSISNQRTLLEKPKSRKVFQRVNADTASLLVQRDTASLASRWTDKLSKISVVFDFDSYLFSSKVYERVFRGSLKDSLRRQQREASPPSLKDFLRRSQPEAFPPPLKEERTPGDIQSLDYTGTLHLTASNRQRPCNILLLGSNEIAKLQAAKSILPWSEVERRYRTAYREAIYMDIMNSGKELTKSLQAHAVQCSRHGNESFWDVNKYPRDSLYTLEAFKKLSRSPCISTSLQEMQPSESLEKARYFLNEADRIAASNYVPTEEDINIVEMTHYGRQFRAHLYLNDLNMEVSNVTGLSRDQLPDTNAVKLTWPILLPDLPMMGAPTCVIFPVDLMKFEKFENQAWKTDDPWGAVGEFRSLINVTWPKHVAIVLFFTNNYHWSFLEPRIGPSILSHIIQEFTKVCNGSVPVYSYCSDPEALDEPIGEFLCSILQGKPVKAPLREDGDVAKPN